ncbi:MAG: hypothetical protein H0X41_09100 [Chitinophagaceae bacterium]|nr:hypothetical protein [Chitinophagaceae bacterium]
MRKAVITGFFTGIVISAVLICATFARPWLPDTFTANLFFMAFFFFIIVGVLWLALNYYCRSSEVKWMTLSATGVISSVIAAIIFSSFSPAPGHSMYNFLDLAIVLFIVSVSIAGIYYVRHRNRVQEHITAKNQELIF